MGEAILLSNDQIPSDEYNWDIAFENEEFILWVAYRIETDN